MLYQNAVYIVQRGIVSIFHPGTGQQLRQERLKNALGEYYASSVAADGKIYFASHEGKITVLKAGTDLQVLAVGDLSEEIIATPAIADRRIYIRTAETLFCYGIKTPQEHP